MDAEEKKSGLDQQALPETTLVELREIHRAFVGSSERRSFSACLMKMIKAKNLNHVDIYKRAAIDRKLFSRIASRKDYIPSKRTILALAIAMELSEEETQRLLHKAGYHLSDEILSDAIIRYFLENGDYDIEQINLALHTFRQPLLYRS